MNDTFSHLKIGLLHSVLLLVAVLFASLAVAQEQADPASPSPIIEEPDNQPLSSGPPESPRELIQLSGIDESHLRPLTDGEPLSDDEQEVLLKLLYRVRKFDLVSIARWTQSKVSLDTMIEKPVEHRIEMFALSGQLKSINVAAPPPEVIDRYEMKQYYHCHVRLGEKQQKALVITAQIPAGWDPQGSLDERISANGLLLKIATTEQGEPLPVFLARDIAWHPHKLGTSHDGKPITLGLTVLGDLGMDAGQFDYVQDSKGISARERECFYQMLWAVESAGTNQLVRQAKENLKQLGGRWQKQFDAQMPVLKEKLAEQKDFQGTAADGQKLAEEIKALKHELAVLKLLKTSAAKGNFSVFPLFNQPDQQRGELVVLEGTARRAIRIEVASNRDVLARFGIDHYFEIEIFTDDSQDNPIVFCVRELPEGFPTGEGITERVRLAGFFFKAWAFQTQRNAGIGADGKRLSVQQRAPLLVGRQPIWIKPKPITKNPYIGAIAGGMFVLALLGLWLGLWSFNRRDQAFRNQTMSGKYAIDEGVSLNDMDIQAEAEPDFSGLE